MYGCVHLCMRSCGYVRVCAPMHEVMWVCTGVCAHARGHVGMYGCVHLCMRSCGYVRVCAPMHEVMWVCTGVRTYA